MNSMFFWLLVVNVALIASGNAAECSTSELLTIASDTHLEGCTSDVGFGGFSAMSALTAEHIQAVCDSSDCMKLMDSMRSMNFGDCTIQGTNISLGKDILAPFERVCSGSGSADLSSSSVGDELVGSSASGPSSSAPTTLVAAFWSSSITLIFAAVVM
ncbi:elicitin-like protein INL3B [Phytophthora infestans T30-4]|uniref:Elicitin n=2 Tax=Phytophthora infestans TaxID=4787 RepID=D0N4P8_PHYIT|nr:elicitin-like protein INL3B [Phytophthora infestans T30-4]ABB55937.1 elicitin-like protein INL3B [Phytophthora infestans]EEY69856.1 elicitin-like protein INL3B [Phytophthora infestans T30-4]KAF4039349.1 Elicitin [Phytophthora infestans]KAF4132334.1 Elicitin [Phytophthora infestans]|eukprot:XP_002998503.1 elicitin-like protein INL3B [Phytophthora infestans T30-4]